MCELLIFLFVYCVYLFVAGAYYCLNMILITLSTLLSVVVVNLYFRGSRMAVPVIFRKVGRIYFCPMSVNIVRVN